MIDHCGGISDLENKIIRTIGNPNERFNEDHLRILRAIRFSNHLNFHIDDDTKKAMTKAYKSIINISIERVRDEITKILSGNNPGNGLKLLDYFGILELFLPEVLMMKM